MNKLFRFNVTKDTGNAAIAGLTIIVLSLLMIPFGIVPAIILTSGFYSLHHAGFQPEFLHLFLVGLMYCGVFYITQNMLIIFPFFWGVGALWDVLVSSEAGNEIKNPISFAIAFIIISVSVIWLLFRKWRKRLNVIENINSDPGNAQEG